MDVDKDDRWWQLNYHLNLQLHCVQKNKTPKYFAMTTENLYPIK